ncbi:Serine carboxypeptidase S28 [Ceratobasidium theobromae]|uniref:Serine carboxypeptidase S28 n=1 Tax=Ceratobasidium theobromae TaxID=1582974 RepID=A0A5N5QA17_9AGAM|nr:Serine carboxypeptidase S28 [Ceratobasidium theobromae]
MGRLFISALVIALVGSNGVLGGRLTPLPLVPTVDAPSTPPVRISNGNTEALPPYDTIYQFDQLIDHKNPSLGTFKQRFYFTYELLYVNGESDFEGLYGFITNSTISGLIAQATNGAVAMLEHRYFGQSYPYPDVKESSLKHLTVEQAIEDLAYFAKNVHLPMPGGDQVPPTKAPWILIGGSYPGALVSWTMASKPDVFWAGYSSSGVVQAINWFWSFSEPIRQYMPKNCSEDVINHVDETFMFGTPNQIQALKENFGMGNLSHADDVAKTLRQPIFRWQSLQPGNSDQGFYKFCDALEVKDGVSATPKGWGLDHALQAFGDYMKDFVSKTCGSDTQEDCLGTYDTSMSFWTNTSLGNSWRSWRWMTCNELGWSKDGAPINWPSLISRLVTPYYDMRQCTYYFPTTFPQARPPNTSHINAKYGGWNIRAPRLFSTNGKRDPWREATVSSDFNPRESTDLQPIVVSEGFHTSDLQVRNGAADKTVYAVQQLAVAYFTKWVKEWQTEHPEAVKGGAVIEIDPAKLVAPAAFVPLTSLSEGGSPLNVPANVTAPPNGAVPPPSSNKDAKKIIADLPSN